MPISDKPETGHTTCALLNLGMSSLSKAMLILLHRSNLLPRLQISGGKTETGQKNLIHFSICACHSCAGAMLIFSVSFQF